MADRKALLSKLPGKPGCYLFKAGGRIIYIGKAKDLRKRVSSYFSKTQKDPKTEALVRQIEDVDFLVTKTEVEAFILENTLVKRHQPRYNIMLKDSKQYAYIQMTDEEFPRLLLARRKDGGGEFFGPFVSGQEREQVMKLLNKTFMLRTCRKLPKKACLRYHIGLCLAPCIGKIDREGYMASMSHARMVMTGRTGELLKKLKDDMRKFSGNEMYEKAIEARDRIAALDYLPERQSMDRDKKYNEDVINYMARKGTVYLVLFNVYRGILSQKSEYVFPETPGFLEEFISRYYSENPVPKEIMLPEQVEKSIVQFLESRRGSKVSVTVPKAGLRKDLLDIARSNVELSFFGGEMKAEDLGKALNINDVPQVIECFDISHLSGTLAVGSMVQFANGRPDKSNYRRFRIRAAANADDYAAIAEVVRRRYSRLKEEGSRMPDLVIIDGGKGQLHAAAVELSKLELRLPIISIAKRLEEVYLPGLSFPKTLERKGRALQYIREIRDEAHRFAISYNRLLRNKKAME
jgi:excinuclease ABC subunit C